MKKYSIFLLIFFFTLNAKSFSNQKIIDNLKNIYSLEFKFIQKKNTKKFFTAAVQQKKTIVNTISTT